MFDSGYRIRLNGINYTVLMSCGITDKYVPIDVVTYIQRHTIDLYECMWTKFPLIEVYKDTYNKRLTVRLS